MSNSFVLQFSKVQTCAVADVCETRIAVAAEISLVDAAIRRSVEYCAPALEFADAVRSLFGMDLSHSPVVNILTAPHCVGEMYLPVVAIVIVAHRRRHAALGHNGVSFAEQRFTNQADGDARTGRFDCGSKTGTAGTDDDNVVFKYWVISH